MTRKERKAFRRSLRRQSTNDLDYELWHRRELVERLRRWPRDVMRCQIVAAMVRAELRRREKSAKRTFFSLT